MDVTLETTLALCALVAASCGAIAMIGLHILPAEADVVAEGTSAYALGPTRSWYAAQAILSGAGALLLAAALASASSEVIGPALLAAYGVTRIAIVRFPTDRAGDAMTTTGRRHALLAAIAFLAIAAAAPIASSLLDTILARPAVATTTDYRMVSDVDGLRAVVNLLAPIVAATCLASFATAALGRTRPYYGLVQRAFHTSAFAWLIAASAVLAFR